MRIIFGLGNPGNLYIHTRHNIGYMVVDRLARRLEIKPRRSWRWYGYVGKVQYQKEEAILVKPTTFMNNSGICIEKFYRHYKLDTRDLLIIYDDIDIELGKMLFRIKGSSAGHKGMYSIIEKLQTEKIPRLRIGIGRPKNKEEDIKDFVLSPFSKEEEVIIEHVIEKAVAFSIDWLGRIKEDILMAKYNN